VILLGAQIIQLVLGRLQISLPTNDMFNFLAALNGTNGFLFSSTKFTKTEPGPPLSAPFRFSNLLLTN